MLAVGQKLGPYEILSPAGAGGMGEVFKARDTRLERVVAIKVLSAQIAGDPDIRQRFEREAKAISSLNHPNICTLFDVGHFNGIDYLVMEYLEGETLSARLTRGPLSAKELMEQAIQIADALDKAHRQGLIHRDLKPGNIMLTKSGAKLLDFGLAKLQQSGDVVAGISGITRSTPLTGEGTIIGTMQYMSPEQLEGKEADARSDIFAFGSILFEMATGRRAFEGKSQATLIAAIIERDPASVSSISPMMPPALDRVVRKCLSKDPESRWQSARDLTDELRWIAHSGSQAGIPAVASVRRRFRLRMAWAIAAVASITAGFIGFQYFTQPTPERPVRRFVIAPDKTFRDVNWPRMSPDGRLLSFLAVDSLGRDMIWIRPLNSLDAYPLAGTEKAGRPFWSPDSKYLAFFIGRQLKKIPVAGGPAQLICESPSGSDGCWGSSNIILFDGNFTDSIRQVPASGGVPTAATTIDHASGEQFHAWPWFLPDGRQFLYLASIDTASQARGDYKLKVGSIDGKVSKELTKVSTRIEYSKAGYILHQKDGILLSQPFDADRLELSGETVPVAENVTGFSHVAFFSSADDGTLVYQVGGSAGRSRLVWYDRSGKGNGEVGTPGAYGDMSLSPDGNHLAYQLADDRSQTNDIWVSNLTRKVSSRLTFDPADDVWPIWSRDGNSIYYASDKSGLYEIMRHLANGTGEPESVHHYKNESIGPSDISRDGSRMIISRLGAGWDVLMLDMTSTDSAEVLVASPQHNEWRGTLSPDGRFLAYQSNESGQSEIYVRELGRSGGKWQISNDNGFSPRWSADGKELFYSNVAWDWIAVPVSTTAGHLEIGNPIKLFNQRVNTTGISQRRYDVTSDGQRFLLNIPLEQRDESKMVVVLNWNQMLNSR